MASRVLLTQKAGSSDALSQQQSVSSQEDVPVSPGEVKMSRQPVALSSKGSVCSVVSRVSSPPVLDSIAGDLCETSVTLLIAVISAFLSAAVIKHKVGQR